MVISVSQLRLLFLSLTNAIFALISLPSLSEPIPTITDYKAFAFPLSID